MKRFQFSLQAVHNVREMRRDAAEIALAAAAAELKGAQAQLETVLRQRQSAMENYLLLHQSKEVEGTTFAWHNDYIGSLFVLERRARAVTLQIEERIANRRQALTEAARATKTTANLRERQRERHHLAVAQNEQKALDEMAIVAVARRRRLATNGEQ